jgi:hypothetical protein
MHTRRLVKLDKERQRQLACRAKARTKPRYMVVKKVPPRLPPRATVTQ